MSQPAARIAMLSVHTCPLDQAGVGDAGGMNVYVTELARALAARGAQVEIFTRAARPGQPVSLADRVLVRYVCTGSPAGLGKADLPDQLGAFTKGALRARGGQPPDLVHSHYWLSGLVGLELARRWDVPLVHTMHTLAKVKNAALAPGDAPEPERRVLGEERVVAGAHALVASTAAEARDLITRYGADPSAVHVVEPGVDRRLFGPGTDVVDAGHLAAAQARARARLGLDPAGELILFAGRVQPLKAPDVLVRALDRMSATRRRVPRLVVLGGPSGNPDAVADLRALAVRHGVSDRVTIRPPVDRTTLAQWYRAADVVAVPSRSESFGLVAAEAQACGTPVVAADVGGLAAIVVDGVTGLLVPGHDPDRWARALADLLADPARRAALGAGAHRHARLRDRDAPAVEMEMVYELAAERRRERAAA